jgi:tetratricopeptide (TPR) repeat protein
MLVVEPSSLRFEDETSASATHEEYLLERISTLENHLMRLTDKLERALDLLLRQARSSYQYQVLLDLLVETLGASQTINEKRLIRVWRERCDRETKEIENAERHQELRAQVVSVYRGDERAAFVQLVTDGFAKLDKRETTRGIRVLERAAALSPDNFPLQSFLGEHFFRVGQRTLARAYLERALAVNQTEPRVCLLLGLVCGDEGEAVRAGDLLTRALENGTPSFAAHYALGRLAAAAEDWRGALAEFKRALALRPSPEAHYVVGLAYYNLDRPRLALRQLLKAVEADAEYAEAFYLLGLVHLRQGEWAEAKEAFKSAHSANPTQPLYRAAKGRGRRTSVAPPSPSLFGTGRGEKKRLLTGGDRRLAVVLQEDAAQGAAGR